MTLYRLDYLDAEGKVTGPVRGSDIGVLTLAASANDILTHHMTTARQHARAAAAASDCDVQIAGIIKGGIVKPRIVIRPDGTGKRPSGAKGEHCKAGKGEGACFCRDCRAARREH